MASKLPTTPKNIVPLITPAQQAAFSVASGVSLTYHGGPLLTNAKVQAIFWGSAWQQPAQSVLIPQLGQFFTFILQSCLMDMLAEYSVPGKTIGHGQYLGPVTTTTPALAGTVSDTQIQQALQGWIASGTVAKPDPNTLYFVYLPPGVVSTLPGASSCLQFCGYHNFFDDAGTQIFYAVEPFITCPGCIFGSGIFDSLTKVSSHELCEAITDPALTSWWDPSTGDEIGDICNGSVTTLGGFVIQTEWSNAFNACRMCTSAPLTGLVHLQDVGDVNLVSDQFAGTRGLSRRLEGFQLDFKPPVPGLSMEYMAHLEGIGDVGPQNAGTFIGTRAQARRLEGFAITLTGAAAPKFTVMYMAHLEGTGDTGFFSNGQFCGTRGQSRRVEGILVHVTTR